MTRNELREQIFLVNQASFEKLAHEIFCFQFHGNEVYRDYCKLIGRTPENVHRMDQIPFLPVELFKSHEIKTGDFVAEMVFESSGTTGSSSSKHYVKELELYQESFLRSFKMFFGAPEDFVILALLPSYLERSNSSLIFMVENLIRKSSHKESGFFLYDHNSLHEQLMLLEARQQMTLLIGVSFALLDFAEKFSMPLDYTAIMETGGMKGRREEITREELHEVLKKSFGVEKICSEYGMTELLSQAYSTGDGKFSAPPWMRVLVRDVNDPAEVFMSNGKESDETSLRTGAVNIIDLANLDSCSFLATQDLMKLDEDGTFEILGRMDFSDFRGCNLMVD